MTLAHFDPSALLISVTPAAHAYFVGQLKDSASNYVRVSVKKSGCTGFKYVIDVDKSAQDTDHVQALEGFALRVDADAIAYINGTVIDLVREGLNKHIRFVNPNVQDQCGCGESFSVKPGVSAH